MCGIIAGLGNNLTKELIRKGLLLTQTRGKDATGVFQTNMGIVKNGTDASQFVESDLFNKVVDNNDLFIGHCRAATSGKPHDNNNNHPMIGNKWIMVHNGVVSMRKLETYQYKGECDTEVLLSYMERDKNIEEAFHDTHGSAAVVFSSVKEVEEGKKIIYFWRNGFTSTLWVAYNEQEQQFLLASTEHILNNWLTTVTLSGLIAYKPSGWVIGEVDQYDFWKVEFTPPTKNNKKGEIKASWLGEKKPKDNPLSKEISSPTTIFKYDANLGRCVKTDNYSYLTRESNKVVSISSAEAETFDCPKEGFGLGNKICKECSLYEDCYDKSMKELTNFCSYSSNNIVKEKKCDSKFDNNEPQCRICIIRRLCASGNHSNWDITTFKGEEKKVTVQ